MCGPVKPGEERKPSIGGPEGPRRRVLKTHAWVEEARGGLEAHGVIEGSSLERIVERRGGGVSGPQGQADRLKLPVNPGSFRLVGCGPAQGAAPEGGSTTAR